MSEFRIVLPKTTQGGFSSDPDQNISNAGSPMLDKQLTIQNGAMIALAFSVGKKVAHAGYNAVVDQIGDGRLEVATIVGQKLATYAGIAALTGPVGLGVAIGAEGLVTGLSFAIESHKISLDNEMKIYERGVRWSFGVNYYD